jgi:hypothetical protein
MTPRCDTIVAVRHAPVLIRKCEPLNVGKAQGLKLSCDFT